MKITINDKELLTTEGDTAWAAAQRVKPDADIIIINGYPAACDEVLHDGDNMVLIKRGEVPSASDMAASLTARNSPDTYEKLKNAKVAIAGAGGLGSNIAMSLARTGVGLIKIVDFDVVEPSNLNRQQYFINQIGMKKVDALKVNMEAALPIVEVIAENAMITRENVGDIFGGYEIVIEALDGAQTKAMFIEESLACLPQAFIIGASGVAGSFATELFVEKYITKRCVIIGDFVNEARKGMGLTAARVAVAANIQANIAVRKILGEI